MTIKGPSTLPLSGRMFRMCPLVRKIVLHAHREHRRVLREARHRKLRSLTRQTQKLGPGEE